MSAIRFTDERSRNREAKPGDLADLVEARQF
jgi:hypothetical protein